MSMRSVLKQVQVNSPAHQWFRVKKDALLLPIARLLSKLHITPNLVTGLGGIIGLLALPLLWLGYGWFVLAHIASLLLDGMDGSLARYTKTQNQTGAQFDHAVDIVLVLCSASALTLWLGEPVWVAVINFNVAVLALNWLLGSPVNIAPGRVVMVILLLLQQPRLALIVYAVYGIILAIAIPITWYKRKASPSQP